ncbi:MAG: hypothetical protein ACK4G1_02595 [Ignavibacteria bacterium]
MYKFLFNLINNLFLVCREAKILADGKEIFSKFEIPSTVKNLLLDFIISLNFIIKDR